MLIPGVVPQLLGSAGLRPLREAIADPARYAIERKVDGVRGLVAFASTVLFSDKEELPSPLTNLEGEIGAIDLDPRGRSTLIMWVGYGCDQTGTLGISPDGSGVTIAPDPIGGCALAPVNRGIILSWTEPHHAASIYLDLEPTTIVGQ